MSLKFYKKKKNHHIRISEISIFVIIILFLYDGWLFSLYLRKTPKEPVTKEKTSVYSIFIDIEECKLYLLDNGKLKKTYYCAVGKDETPSPIGNFTIIKKSNWGEGFGGYWMGLDCTWGQYGIHGTTKPQSVGLPSSHGCFRLTNNNAKELFDCIPIGTKVCVSGGCYGAFGNGFRLISFYTNGLDVQLVQKKLKMLGYYSGECNGKYNTEQMRIAIHKYQRDNNLIVSDNINKKMLNSLGFVLME